MTPTRRHDRAFVVQFDADAGFSGTVEHVASGRTGRFRSPDELALWLSTGRIPPPAGPLTPDAPIPPSEERP